MIEEWLQYLIDHAPELASRATSSMAWQAKWRDDRIRELEHNFQNWSDMLVPKCNAHTGVSTPRFDVWLDRYANRCVVCDADHIRELEAKYRLALSANVNDSRRIRELKAESDRLSEEKKALIGMVEMYADDRNEERKRRKAAEAKLERGRELPRKWREYSFDNENAKEFMDAGDCADELDAALQEQDDE